MMGLISKGEKFYDQYGPEKVMIIRDPQIGMEGFLVIDNSSYGIPMGGLRMAPDLDITEIIRLARAMTLKYCTYQVPLGGAKAGLITRPNVDKNLLIANFAESIKPLIKGGGFYPEPGLGTLDTDIERILKLTGKPDVIPGKIGNLSEDIPIEKKYTGVSVALCIESIFKNLEKYIKTSQSELWSEPPNLLMEGFGRAGIEIARRVNALGFQIKGLSTLRGAIFDEDGLDINRLMDLRKEHGDDVVNVYESKNLVKTESEKLFELSSEYSIDFLVPGARPNVINKENLDKIQAKAIVPASSIPYEYEILDDLKEKGILAIPDFVSSGGDALELELRPRNKEEKKIIDHIGGRIKNKTLDVVKNSYEKNITPYKYAKELAIQDLEKKLKREKKFDEKLDRIVE